jgi:WhiB family redox-sensing transcriptional regulator
MSARGTVVLPLADPLMAQRFLIGAAPACRREGVDPELFFPHEGGSVEPARRICLRCPLREPCAEWAVEAGQQHGVWGGLSTEQIRQERLRRYADA